MKIFFIAGLLLTASWDVAKSQNVGIGTANPAEKLQVAGNIKADTVKPGAIRLTTNAGSGKVLTSDATGNASWQQMSAPSGQGAGSWGDCSMNGVGNYQGFGDTAGAADDHLGYRVAISGDFAVASSPFDDVGGNVEQGSVSFFHFNGSTWDIVQKVTEAGGSAGDFFGASVAISGDYAIIGTPGDDFSPHINQGSASIYHYNGTAWVFLQKCADPTGQQEDFFGISVSIDGNFAVVGANLDDIGPNSNQGSACIFQKNGSVWAYMQKINDAFGATEDNYGTSVAISGNNIIVGEPGDDITFNADQGAALFYYFNGSSWVLRIKLTDANGNAGDNFGFSTSISGNNVAIGSPNYDWTQTNQGVVSLYRLNGNAWEFVQRLQAGEPGESEGFGYSIAISGNFLIVGTPNDNVGGINLKGSATIYEKVGIGWAKLQWLHDKMGAQDDMFAFSVAINGDTKQFLAGVFAHGQGSGKIIFGKIF
jgi:hypothetical protein